MIIRRDQRGFTLLEIIVVLAVMAVLAAAILPPTIQRFTESKADASIEQAKLVLQVCEIARTKALSTAVDGSGRYTHTYGSLANWSSTSALQALLSKNYNLASTNPLRSQILVKFDAARCYVAVDLPFREDNYGGYQTQTVAGLTRVIVTTRQKRSGYPSWVIHQKRILNEEVSR